jgi:ankyrin repeat protein
MATFSPAQSGEIQRCLMNDDVSALLSFVDVSSFLKSHGLSSLLVDPLLQDGACFLSMAAYYGATRCLNYMLSVIPGNPLEALDYHDRTIVHFAAACTCGGLAAFCAAQASFPNPTAISRIESADRDGWRPVHYAAYRGNLDVLRLCWVGGADMSATSSDGNPAHVAIQCGRDAALQFLLRIGVSVREVTPAGLPSICLVRNGPKVRQLLDILCGAGIDLTEDVLVDGEMWPLLFYFMNRGARGDEQIVKILVAMGIDPMAQSSRGISALQFAAEEGLHDMNRVLRDCIRKR